MGGSPKGGDGGPRPSLSSPRPAKRARGSSGGLKNSLSWTSEQYAKYDAYRKDLRRAREAAMWQGNSGPSAAARLPPKLQFKRLMETTGPAPHQTMIDTLLSMGFTQEQAESATRATNGRSVEDAAAFLLTGSATRQRRGGR